MHRFCRAFFTGLVLGLGPSTAVASDDDLDFDDDFFEEVSNEKRARTERDGPEAPVPDPLDDEADEDPGWDEPVDPDIIDDPPDDFGDPDDDFGEDPEDGFDSDLAGPSGEATVSPPSDFDGFGEDPPDDFVLPAPRKPAAAAPPAAPAAPAGPARLTLQTAGKAPLSGAYDAAVVAVDVDAVVVELPVLIAASGSDFAGAPFTVVASFLQDGKTIGESRHLVSRASIADLGPTVVWVKQHVPVTDPSGRVEISVSRIDAAAEPATVLFKKTVDYRL